MKKITWTTLFIVLVGSTTQWQHCTEAFTGLQIPSQPRLLSTPSLQHLPKSLVAPVTVSSDQRLLRRQLPTAPSPSSFALRMVSYEDLVEKLPSPAVLNAVQSVASRGHPVVAADVAAAAGVSLSQARRDLTALASLTRGDIAVSTDGDLLYTFPANINAALTSRSVKYRAVQAFRRAWPSLFWLLRVSFGVTLLVSIVAIFSTIFFISNSSSSDSDDRRNSQRGGGMRGGYGGGYFGSSWFGPLDFLYYRPYGYYGYYSTPQQQQRPQQRRGDEMGFLESVFSYIFGDGNPNAQLEEKRLQLAANMIRQNKGAVTAEQLAPFCDEAPDPSRFTDPDATYVDESFVLPIVSALDGEPQVTDDGDIIYVFPELQATALSSSPTKAVSILSEDARREKLLLQRAGLKPNASTNEIKQLLNYNGISTWSARERRDLLRLLDRALPPMTQRERAELEQESAPEDPSLLQERPYKFSLASDTNRFLAAALGAVNLGGALFLGQQLQQLATYAVRLPSYFGLVQSLYPFLLGYAVLFNVIPFVRSLWVKSENAKIQQRNQLRRKWDNFVASMTGQKRTVVGRKLQAAAKMSPQVKRLGARDAEILFDTRKPMEEIEKLKQSQSLKDFDKLLDADKQDGAFQ